MKILSLTLFAASFGFAAIAAGLHVDGQTLPGLIACGFAAALWITGQDAWGEV